MAEKQRACETDLAKAEPALIAAQEALDTLNKVRESAALRLRAPGCPAVLSAPCSLPRTT